MESRLRHGGSPPPQADPFSSWLADPPRDGWLGRSASTLTKRTCFSSTRIKNVLNFLSPQHEKEDEGPGIFVASTLKRETGWRKHVLFRILYKVHQNRDKTTHFCTFCSMYNSQNCIGHANLSCLPLTAAAFSGQLRLPRKFQVQRSWLGLGTTTIPVSKTCFSWTEKPTCFLSSFIYRGSVWKQQLYIPTESGVDVCGCTRWRLHVDLWSLCCSGSARAHAWSSRKQTWTPTPQPMYLCINTRVMIDRKPTCLNTYRILMIGRARKMWRRSR